MPPIVPRKRLRDHSPETPKVAKTKAKAKGKSVVAPPRKPTLFDNIDATSTPGSLSDRRAEALKLDESSDDSLSSLSDADFEDVLPKKRQKVAPDPPEDDDDDEDMEFEDVPPQDPVTFDAPMPTGDLELTLTRDTRISLVNPLDKKGPSKLERKMRIATHCMHVQFLMWHNAIRNAWLCNPEIHGILMSHVPPRLWEELDRWRRNSGLETPKPQPPPAKSNGNSKAQKGAASKTVAKAKTNTRSRRDWAEAAKRLEEGAVDMSHGDPLFRLMKGLMAWWKQRFRVTAPGLRKVGYMTLERLDRLTKAYVGDEDNIDSYGERVLSFDDFKTCAQELTGSRDIGAQLFTALLRAIGLEARMVASLQPLGFGWNKLEDADPEPDRGSSAKYTNAKATGTITNKAKSTKGPTDGKRISNSRSSNPKLVKDDASDSEDFELRADEESDASLDLPGEDEKPKSGKAYDKALEYPHYWTEVLSPVTSKYLPVDAMVKSLLGTSREKVELFEPRGSKAEKAKQVMAYVVGFSMDGTAKDVTVRYLKRQMLPGRTKGMRMPIEKVPVYNRHGKVKRHELFDWFKSVMRGYARGGKNYPFTETDSTEDATDLKPAKAEKREVKEGEETLQYYKQSKDFVLERHFKREEALLPSAEPVKMFKVKTKGSDPTEEPVYSRKDVVQVKSAETWHKQGRAPQAGEQPLKRVPYRAATTNRRREIAEAERATGEKVLQGLYSFDQTEWIIPDPIENGVIPKNEYGNIDLFAEHMCPQGAVHVPFRGAVKVCKRLEIDYAEAVVDFEFGHRMAVPVIQGVVIAEEYHTQVMEEIAKDEAERARKEDEKRRKAALGKWRKFLMGLRIVQRIQQDYGDIQDDNAIFGSQRSREAEVVADEGDAGSEMGGGFLPEGFEVEEVPQEAHRTSGFFPIADENEEDDGENVLEIDHGSGAEQSSGLSSLGESKPVQSAPVSRPRRQAAAKKKAPPKRSGRRVLSISEDEEEDTSEASDESD